MASSSGSSISFIVCATSIFYPLWYCDNCIIFVFGLSIKLKSFKKYKINTKVNIETDMFARYIFDIFQKKDDLSWDNVDKIMAIMY